MTIHSLIETAAENIHRILRSGNVPSYASADVLNGILDELHHMDSVRNSGEYLPSSPRIIVDSWPLDDTLGQKLLELAELYRRTR